jgi:long-chain acyl-CoA synthetase
MPDMSSESLLNFALSYAKRGDEICVRQHRGYRMESWSYRRIGEVANQVARELEARGIGKGDAVLLAGENSAEWIMAFLGCLLAGAVIVPIDFGSTPEFAGQVARDVRPKLIFCSKDKKLNLGLPVIELDQLVVLTSPRDASPYHSPSLRREDTLEIIYTSGTTAEPRGVIISHGNVLANIERLEPEIRKYIRYERPFHPLRFLNLLPLSHVFGQMLGVFIPQLITGTVVFADSLKPSDLAETIRRERISVMVTVPRFLESLKREMERQEDRAGRLQKFARDLERAGKIHFLRRWWLFRRIHGRLGWKLWAFISGGAALPEEIESFWKSLGYAVIQGYGMTETTSLISLNHPFSSAQGSIGKAFPGMEIKIADNGEILVRGEAVARGYRQNGMIQALVEENGWLRTGDIARKDENGRLYFKGRSKNVIVTPAGMNIYPEDLEKALRAQPGVRDCIVLGIEAQGNAEACAVLLLKPEAASASVIVAGANRMLADYQRIYRWFVWPDADFPRTATQKPILPRIRMVLQQAETGDSAEPVSVSPIAQMVSRITGKPAANVSNGSGLETALALSSVDRVELMSAMEERFQVDLNDVDFQDVQTIGQLQKLVACDAPAKTRHVYPRWPQHWITRSVRLIVYYLFAWPATYILAAPRVKGRENLSGLTGPILVISNHVTYLDIAWILPALPARFRNRLATAMGGERLARMRRPADSLNWFERFMERLRYVLVTSLFNVFPLPQQSGFLESFHFAGDLADRDWNVLVFPEGKTTETGDMNPFRSGIGLLAKELGLPVVPIYLEGLFNLKREDRIVAKRGEVRVTIGAPVHVEPAQSSDEVTLELERRVRTLQGA